jgi:hypothetical protein
LDTSPEENAFSPQSSELYNASLYLSQPPERALARSSPACERSIAGAFSRVFHLRWNRIAKALELRAVLAVYA